MNASDLFIKALENEGVEYIFGIPGEENLDLLEGLRKSKKIKLILTRHEQGAGFMAATYGRLTGKVGVCVSTLGPGATNFTTAAAYAQLGGMPMLMITGQKPIKKSKQGRFQIIDVVGMMKPLTKFAKVIVNGNNSPAIIREAFKIATTERPGAVHIEFPEDISAEENCDDVIVNGNNSPAIIREAFKIATTERPGAVHIEFPEDISAEENCDDNIYPVQDFEYPTANKKSIAAAVAMIEKAKRPLLCIGNAANRGEVSDALTKFVDEMGIPFFSTQMGKGVVNENHELCLSTAALSKDDFLHCAIDRADVIINVGHDVIEKPPFFMENKEGATKVIHLNFFPSEVDDTYFPQLDVVGDITTSVDALTDALTAQAHWDFDYYKRLAVEIRTKLSKYFGDTRFPILPQKAVRTIRQTLTSDDDIVTLDNGVYKIWFARNYRCAKPNTLLLDNALATMGAGLPSGMAAKMVRPNSKVVSVCGDGGFMMNDQELETAVRLGLDLTVVILNDNSYGMIKWKQAGMGFENFGLDLGNPDFVMFAESFGASGHRPTSCEDFAETLEKCVNTKGVHVIDLAVDYSLNHAILNDLLANKQCMI